jgi:hypothetical protein
MEEGKVTAVARLAGLHRELVRAVNDKDVKDNTEPMQRPKVIGLQLQMRAAWKTALEQELQECVNGDVMGKMWQAVFKDPIMRFKKSLRRCDEKLCLANLPEHSQNTSLNQHRREIKEKRAKILVVLCKTLKVAYKFFMGVYKDLCVRAQVREDVLRVACGFSGVADACVIMRGACEGDHGTHSLPDAPCTPPRSLFASPEQHMALYAAYKALIYGGDCQRYYINAREQDRQGRQGGSPSKQKHESSRPLALYTRAVMLLPSYGHAQCQLGALLGGGDAPDWISSCYYFLFASTQVHIRECWRDNAQRNLQTLVGLNNTEVATGLGRQGLDGLMGTHINDVDSLSLFAFHLFGLLHDSAQLSDELVHERGRHFFSLTQHIMAAVRNVFFPFLGSTRGDKRGRAGRTKKNRHVNAHVTCTEPPSWVCLYLYKVVVICICLLRRLDRTSAGHYYLRCVTTHFVLQLMRIMLDVLLHDGGRLNPLHAADPLASPSSSSSFSNPIGAIADGDHSNAFLDLLGPICLFFTTYDDQRDVLVREFVPAIRAVTTKHRELHQDAMEANLGEAAQKLMALHNMVFTRMARLLNALALFAVTDWFSRAFFNAERSGHTCNPFLPEQLMFRGGSDHGPLVSCEAFHFDSATEREARAARTNRIRADVEHDDFRLLWHRGIASESVDTFPLRIQTLLRVMLEHIHTQPAFMELDCEKDTQGETKRLVRAKFSCKIPRKWGDAVAMLRREEEGDRKGSGGGGDRRLSGRADDAERHDGGTVDEHKEVGFDEDLHSLGIDPHGILSEEEEEEEENVSQEGEEEEEEEEGGDRKRQRLSMDVDMDVGQQGQERGQDFLVPMRMPVLPTQGSIGLTSSQFYATPTSRTPPLNQKQGAFTIARNNRRSAADRDRESGPGFTTPSPHNGQSSRAAVSSSDLHQLLQRMQKMETDIGVLRSENTSLKHELHALKKDLLPFLPRGESRLQSPPHR